MAKPAIAWAVRNDYDTWQVIELISYDEHYYYGRSTSGRRTHGTRHALSGIYPDEATARRALDLIKGVMADHAPAILEVERAKSAAYNERRMAIAAVIEANKVKTDG